MVLSCQWSAQQGIQRCAVSVEPAEALPTVFVKDDGVRPLGLKALHDLLPRPLGHSEPPIDRAVDLADDRLPPLRGVIIHRANSQALPIKRDESRFEIWVVVEIDERNLSSRRKKIHDKPEMRARIAPGGSIGGENPSDQVMQVRRHLPIELLNARASRFKIVQPAALDIDPGAMTD